MITYLLVAMAFLFSALVIFRVRGNQISVLFVFIVMMYVLVGPFVNSFSKVGGQLETYYLYHASIIILFYFPFIGIIATSKVINLNHYGSIKVLPANNGLPVLFPLLLLIFLVIFWNTVIDGGLLFRRIGHDALFRASAAMPKFQLYTYRLAVETSFFVILALSSVLTVFDKATKNRLLFKVTLIAYSVSFLAYFFINSRMQFLLLVLVLILNVTGHSKRSLRKVFWLGLTMIIIIASMTLLREFYLEGNDRLDDVSLASVFLSTLGLIAARVDILEVLYQLDKVSFDPLSTNLTGIKQSIYFPLSFFIDPAYYENTKATLQTSSAVAVVNDITGGSFIDFPKTYVIDTILTFGMLGLPFLAVLYGGCINKITNLLSSVRRFGFKWLCLIFLIPILLQFEKELMSPFLYVLKWSPMLLISIWSFSKIKLLAEPVLK